MSNAKHNILLSLLFLSSAACSSGSSNKAESTIVAAQPEAAATAEALPAAEEILTRAIEVTGGRAAYEAVKSFKIGGTFSLPAQGINGKLVVYGASGNRMNAAVEIPGMGTERNGSDGTTVWSMSAMTGSRILEGSERARTLRDSDLLKELNWSDYYKSATTTGTAEVDGKTTFTVEMVDNYDIKETRYYEKESGLMVRQTGIVQSQMGEMKNDIHLRDYKEFGGILVPSVMEVEVMGMKQVMTTTSIEINAEVSDETFALPAEIQQIVAAAK